MITRLEIVSIFLLGATLLLSGCTLSDKNLHSGWWKYSKGYNIGDVVDFKNGFSLNKDTVLRNGNKVGVVTRRTKGVLGGDNEIEVTSLDGKQVGVYHQK